MSANKQFDFYNPDSMYYANSKHYIAQLEAMSRQQQAEIEALKQIIDANNLNQNIGQFVKPANEPVAYLMVERNDGNSYIQMSVPTRDEKISHHPYPLYTHPVKELTDAIETLKYLLKVAQEDFKTMNSHFVIEQVKQALKELSDE